MRAALALLAASLGPAAWGAVAEQRSCFSVTKQVIQSSTVYYRGTVDHLSDAGRRMDALAERLVGLAKQSGMSDATSYLPTFTTEQADEKSGPGYRIHGRVQLRSLAPDPAVETFLARLRTDEALSATWSRDANLSRAYTPCPVEPNIASSEIDRLLVEGYRRHWSLTITRDGAGQLGWSGKDPVMLPPATFNLGAVHERLRRGTLSVTTFPGAVRFYSCRGGDVQTRFIDESAVWQLFEHTWAALPRQTQLAIDAALKDRPPRQEWAREPCGLR